MIDIIRAARAAGSAPVSRRLESVAEAWSAKGSDLRVTCLELAGIAGSQTALAALEARMENATDSTLERVRAARAAEPLGSEHAARFMSEVLERFLRASSKPSLDDVSAIRAAIEALEARAKREPSTLRATCDLFDRLRRNRTGAIGPAASNAQASIERLTGTATFAAYDAWFARPD